jgi:hypothetical protein
MRGGLGGPAANAAGGDTNMPAPQTLTLLGLLNLANEAYPDGFLAEYYDAKTGERQQGGGDSLARFIVTELSKTFDSGAARAAQLQEARNALNHAVDDLERVIEALS